jgi:amphi-Trp domain-containing protein
MPEETVHESTETRSRKGIASYFRRLARRFSRGEPVPADEEQTVTVSVPAEADLETEVEREGDELSLEIEVAWAEEEDDVEVDVAASKATFEVYGDNAEEYRWRLVHDNGNVIADGGEGYASKQKAEQGLRSVKQNVRGAAIERDD